MNKNPLIVGLFLTVFSIAHADLSLITMTNSIKPGESLSVDLVIQNDGEAVSSRMLFWGEEISSGYFTPPYLSLPFLLIPANSTVTNTIGAVVVNSMTPLGDYPFVTVIMSGEGIYGSTVVRVLPVVFTSMDKTFFSSEVNASDAGTLTITNDASFALQVGLSSSEAWLTHPSTVTIAPNSISNIMITADAAMTSGPGHYSDTLDVTYLNAGSPADSFSIELGVGVWVGPQLDSAVIQEVGGVNQISGVYEPGEVLEIIITSTNGGGYDVSNIKAFLEGPVGFSITPLSSTSYPFLAVRDSTSSVYRVSIDSEVASGTYTFIASNTASGNVWVDSASLSVLSFSDAAEVVPLVGSIAIMEAGGRNDNPGFPEAGEVLNITMFSENSGSVPVADVEHTLSADSSFFTITAISNPVSYASMNVGAVTSTTYQVVIDATTPLGIYPFYATNGAAGSFWSDLFDLSVLPQTNQLFVLDGSGDGFYAVQDAAAIVADPVSPGQRFDRWMGDTQSVADVTSSSTTVTIPAHNIEISATYMDDSDHPPGLTALDTLFDDPTADAEAIVYSNGYAYVACGYAGIIIFDVSDPANPLRVGGYDTEGFAMGIAIQSNRLFIADDRFGLQIIDVTSPENPVLLGHAETRQDAEDIVVVGDYAYVAASSYGLQIFDVGDVSTPVLVGEYDTYRAFGVAVAGNCAYVADYTEGLKIIDISTPSAPVLLGSYVGLSSARDVAVQGGFAYVADYTNGLQIIDVSDPVSPVLVGGYVTKYGYDVFVNGLYAYLSNSGYGVEMVDVRNPATPVFVDKFDDNQGMANGVFVAEGMAYVANDYGGMQIVDVSTPANLSLLGSYDTHRYAYDIEVKGSYAYVAAYRDGLITVDISKPDAPVVVSTNKWRTYTYAMGIDVVDNLAYVAQGYYGLAVFDLSVPSDPALVSEYNEGNEQFWDVKVLGDYAFCVNNSYSEDRDSTNAFCIVDISDPVNPAYVGGGSTGGRAYGIDVQGQYAYLASYTNGFYIFDVSDPANPLLKGSYKRSLYAYAGRVSVSGSYAYVLENNDVLQIIDVTDAENPTLRKMLDLGSITAMHSDVVAEYPYVYIAWTSPQYPEKNGLWVVDVRDMDNLIVTNYPTSGSGRGVAVRGGYVYLADDPELLHVFTFGEKEESGLSIDGFTSLLSQTTNTYECYIDYTDGSKSNATDVAHWSLIGDSHGANFVDHALSVGLVAEDAVVTIQVIHAGYTNTLDVALSILDHFEFSAIDSPQAAGTSFEATLEAKDKNGSLISVYEDTVLLSANGDRGPVMMTPTNVIFVNGACLVHVCVNTPDKNIQISADNGAGCSGLSDPFNLVVGPVNSFVWDSVASPQYEENSFLSRIKAVDSAGNVVISFSDGIALHGFQDTPVFTENFDDGNYDGWVDGLGPYIRQVTNDTTAGGVGSLTLIGGDRSHYNGVSRTLDNLMPDEVIVYVRSSSTTNACGYFILGQESGTDAAVWFFMRAGDLYLNNPEVSAPPYEANRWYKNAFRFDWTARTVDWYVDGCLAASDVPFRGATVSNLTYMALYNYNEDSQAWWDEIQFIQSTPVTVSPTDSGFFSNGVWTGSVTVAEAATNMYLLADGGSGRIGVGNLFTAASALLDTDADGLADWWERCYFGDALTGLPDVDLDGDGQNNLQEYIFGTNPTNRQDANVFSACYRDRCLNMEVRSCKKRLYTIEGTDDLMSSNWTVLARFFGTGIEMTWLDPAASGLPCQYYRINAEVVGYDPAITDSDGDGMNDMHDPAPFSKDSDQDGMPDSWEIDCSLNSSVSNGVFDSDHDGYSDYAEYVFGTRPDDADSRFFWNAEQTQVDGQTQWLFNVSTMTGRVYQVDYKPSMTASWTALRRFEGTDEIHTFSLIPSNGDTGYFRILAGNGNMLEFQAD